MKFNFKVKYIYMSKCKYTKYIMEYYLMGVEDDSGTFIAQNQIYHNVKGVQILAIGCASHRN